MPEAGPVRNYFSEIALLVPTYVEFWLARVGMDESLPRPQGAFTLRDGHCYTDVYSWITTHCVIADSERTCPSLSIASTLGSLLRMSIRAGSKVAGKGCEARIYFRIS